MKHTLEEQYALEEQLRRIKEIVQALDSDDLDLEEAVSLFKEGSVLIQRAQEALDQVDLWVEELIGPDGKGRRWRSRLGDGDDA